MRTVLLNVFLFFSFVANAQKLTGTWEGELNGQFFQMNIVDVNGQLCGYTYDYVKNDKSSFCKQYFFAFYNGLQKTWVFTGTSFIEQGGGHYLMRLRMKYKTEDDKVFLQGLLDARPSLENGFSGGISEFIQLQKVSSKPAYKYPYMEECIKQAKKKSDKEKNKKSDTEKKSTDTKIKKEPTLPVESNPSDKPGNSNKNEQPQNEKEETEKNTQNQPPITENSKRVITTPSKVTERKMTEVSRITVNVPKLELEVYDNGTVDNDTVSIYYNGKLLVDKKMLSEKPITISLQLDTNKTTHEITLFAENLGSIPPNTALIIVKAGDKRYELRSKASLTENAILVFEYKPQ